MFGILKRLWNLLTGWMYQKEAELEMSQPGAVFDAAINESVRKYDRMEKAVGGLAMNRNMIEQDLKQERDDLVEVQAMLGQAIQDAQSDNPELRDEAMTLGETLQEQEERLTRNITMMEESYSAASEKVDDYQKKLIQFKAQINNMEQEKHTAIAQSEADRQSIRLNRELDGLSTDVESKAVVDLRKNLSKLHAQANVSDEMRGKSYDEKMTAFKEKAGSRQARSKFMERVEAAKGPAVEEEKDDAAQQTERRTLGS